MGDREGDRQEGRQGDRGREPYGVGPPTRPTFEFRTPPSAVPAPRPQALTVSSTLWLASAGAGLLAVVLPLVGIGDLHGALTAVVDRDFAKDPPATRERAVALAAAVLVGGGILLALLEAGFAVMMRSGRGGARIVLVLLLVPAVLHAWLLLSVASQPSAACLVLGLGLALVASVLMFQPGATTWFARRQRL